MIIRTLIVFAIAALAPLGINAQDWSWMEKAPGKYVGANTAKIISSESACNQNGEAFKDFIPRFRTDKAFRNSRIRLAADDQIGAMGLQYCDFKLLKASRRNTRCDKSYGTWYNVSANEVCFQYNDVLPCNDDVGGGSVSARFQRIDGKWYCTGFMAAG